MVVRRVREHVAAPNWFAVTVDLAGQQARAFRDRLTPAAGAREA